MKHLEYLEGPFEGEIIKKPAPYVAYSKADDMVYYNNITLNYEYVDLGLSVKWASCNLGAESPEKAGMYFAWGETKPKETYTRDNYKWSSDGNLTSFTKYCTNEAYGIVDNKEILEPSDDAAYVLLGDGWRIPTTDEWTELRTNSVWAWETVNGVEGFKIISNINGNSIFLPAVGNKGSHLLDNRTEEDNNINLYQTSVLCTPLPYDFAALQFDNEDMEWYVWDRCVGTVIRPVIQ